MGVQEVSWDNGRTVGAGDFNFSTKKENKIVNWKQDILVHHRIVSAVKRVEFVNDRVSFSVLKGRWCNIIVRNVLEPSEDKSDGSKDSL